MAARQVTFVHCFDNQKGCAIIFEIFPKALKPLFWCSHRRLETVPGRERQGKREERMKQTLKIVALACAALLWVTTASAQVTKQDADLAAPDGLKLKVTYYSAGKSGPGVLLLHQCNRERKTWDPLATQLAAAGIHVLTLDYRGYGESGGERFLSLTPQQQAAAREKWPGDIDTAFKYLLDQTGVDKARLGAGGGSCGGEKFGLFGGGQPPRKKLGLFSRQTQQEGPPIFSTTARLPRLRP